MDEYQLLIIVCIYSLGQSHVYKVHTFLSHSISIKVYLPVECTQQTVRKSDCEVGDTPEDVGYLTDLGSPVTAH